jgi:uncharacterized metal-binding protein
MPGFRLHDKATVLTAGTAAVVVASITGDPWPTLATGLGSLGGLILTPDLDVNTGSISQIRVRKWFGPAVGSLWFVYWWAYGGMFSHRGISHWPIIGTLTRILYGGLLLWPFLQLPNHLWAWMLLGLMLSDLAHYLLDSLDKAVGGRL